jgi:hypothetical protein
MISMCLEEWRIKPSYHQLRLFERRLRGASFEDINNTLESPCSDAFVLVAQEVGVGQVLGERGKLVRVDLVLAVCSELRAETFESAQQVSDWNGLAGPPCYALAEVESGDIVLLLRV